ncbi:HupE/UreJ family protein [Ruegeria profundi]|uniref:Uncharacterized protein n=1 Tax=Ruegeria profundi TaxID=1685378 RepID=A0A0X3TWJ2_9RHOB|nr:HupE/UreJ family protein [Ruegeria profundi]KUJ80058.1 hypothetical protein AVO44_07795 [Ruegeria profundi]
MGLAASAASAFIFKGIRHVLEGRDHLLFVICMILSAATLRALVARATGFTVGHSVTLVMAYFGLAPQISWFIPAVEALIAPLIILRRDPRSFETNGE